MKKLCAIVLCILMLTSSVPAFAAGGLAIDAVDVDYRNEQITVKCSTDVGYRQRVIAVIYAGNTDPAVWSSYVHMGEATTDLNGECTFNFILDTTLTNTTYTVTVTGSGVSSDSVSTTFSIIPLTTEDTLMSGADDGANYNDPDLTANELADLFNDNASAIGLDGESLSSGNADDLKVLNTMLSIRNDDFSGSFNDLTEVSETYEKANALVDIGNTTTGAEMQTALTENNNERAQLLGIDLTSESDKAKDYRATEEAVNNLLSSMDSKSPSMSVSDFQKRFGEALATATVNSVDVDTMASKINLYSTELGIDSASLAKFNALNSTDKLAVARMLTNKSFTDAASINTAFSNALTLVIENPSTDLGNDTGYSGGGGGGGVSVGGGSGGSFGASSGSTLPIGTYTDSHEFLWAEEPIKVLSGMGVISGYDDGSFGGNRSISRSEFIKMIVVALGLYDSSATCSFTDAQSDAWYYAFIGSAVKAGLITGYSDGSFGVNDSISREDAAVIIHRALLLINADLAKENSATSFSDNDMMSDYSRDAISELQQYSIINGFGDGTYGPKLQMTRAQVAKLIFELLKRI